MGLGYEPATPSPTRRRRITRKLTDEDACVSSAAAALKQVFGGRDERALTPDRPSRLRRQQDSIVAHEAAKPPAKGPFMTFLQESRDSKIAGRQLLAAQAGLPAGGVARHPATASGTAPGAAKAAAPRGVALPRPLVSPAPPASAPAVSSRVSPAPPAPRLAASSLASSAPSTPAPAVASKPASARTPPKPPAASSVPPPPQPLTAAAAARLPFKAGPRPEDVRKDWCMARTWAGGFGAQCSKKPLDGRDYCGTHSEGHLAHGRVDGTVPHAKLQVMLKAMQHGRSSAAAADRPRGRKRRRGDDLDAALESVMEEADVLKEEQPGANDSTPRGLLLRAASSMRPGAVGGQLLGREKEQAELSRFLREGLRSGGRREVLYVSGMPGTGKTASVLEAIKQLQQQAKGGKGTPFVLAHVNAMCLSSPGAVFAEICRKVPAIAQAVGGGRGRRRLSESQACAALDKFAEDGGLPTGEVVVMVLDEVDCLVTQAQAVLYRLFEWAARPGARLAVVAIANTMDLPERLLPRISSRIGVLRVNFAPYDRAQLQTILHARLRRGGAEGALSDEAVMLCAARVAASSGDARKAMQVCRRALEAQLEKAVAEGCEPSPVGPTQLAAAETSLLRANPAAHAVTGLGLKARRLLLAIVLELRRLPDSGAAPTLPLKVVLHRYQGLHNLETESEQRDAVPLEDVEYLVSRLEALSVLRTLEPTSSGEGGLALELGESLDVDDVAAALASLDQDAFAKELLGCAAGGLSQSATCGS